MMVVKVAKIQKNNFIKEQKPVVRQHLSAGLRAQMSVRFDLKFKIIAICLRKLLLPFKIGVEFVA